MFQFLINKRKWLCLFILLVAAGCSSSGGQKSDRYSEKQAVMGTFMQIDVCANASQSDVLAQAYQKAWHRIKEIAWRMNVYNDRSDVTRLNQAIGVPVELGADTYDLLLRSREYSKNTDRAFDVTVWPLIARWRQAAEQEQDPSESELDLLRQSLSMTQLTFLPESRVARANEIIQIDLGGVAKGYAIDQTAHILTQSGFHDYFIDAGGDVYVSGQNCQGQKWRIGVQNPQESGSVLHVAGLSNQAMATSGYYQQFFKVGDKTYSHIIDPATGYPQENVVSASVIAPTAEEADAYATALTVMGADKAIQFIETLGESYAAFVVEKNVDGDIRQMMSTSFGNYLIR